MQHQNHNVDHITNATKDKELIFNVHLVQFLIFTNKNVLEVQVNKIKKITQIQDSNFVSLIPQEFVTNQFVPEELMEHIKTQHTLAEDLLIVVEGA